MPASDAALIDELAALALEQLGRIPVVRADDAAHAKLVGYYSKGLSHEDSGLEVLRGPDGKLRAFACHWFEVESWFGVPCRDVTLHRRLADSAAQAWLCEAYDRIAGPPDAPDRTIHVHAQSSDPLVRDHLVRRGYGIEAAVTYGEAEAALERLVSACDPPRDLSALGLELAPLSSEADVDAFTALSRQTFSDEPQWCWFGASDAFLAAQRESLLEALATPESHCWQVVRRDGRFAGMFGCSIDLDNPIWGPSAGMDLLLAPELRGRGVLKTAYRLTLEAMIAAGARVFRGGTSQPGVMHYARLMGRQLTSTAHHMGAPFPPEHFRPVLETASA